MTTRYLGGGIERRRRKLYAVLDVPKALREKIGKRRFVQSLQTDSLQVAKRRAPVLMADWKAQIAAARDNQPIDDATFFRQALKRTRNAQEASRILAEIEIEADNRSSVSVMDTDTAAIRIEKERIANEEAVDFYKEATGQKVMLADHIDDWLETTDLSPRTLDAAQREVKAFAKQFPSVDDITKSAIQDYVYDVAKGVARGTVQKRMSYLRGLWKYLQRNKLAPDTEPFTNLDIPKQKRNGNGKSRLPFSRDDLKRLMAESEGAMQAVIILAAYTGARFSELTSLKIEDVSEDAFHIRGGKTDAAEREIPIHSNIKGMVKHLVAESQDGWLLEGEGLAVNNLGERGRTLGKAFGLFKTKLGYDERYVFHSIRKSVATMFEEAQVPEFIAARILGHTLKTMSYGVYSGGVDLETKREAIEKAIKF